MIGEDVFAAILRPRVVPGRQGLPRTPGLLDEGKAGQRLGGKPDARHQTPRPASVPRDTIANGTLVSQHPDGSRMSMNQALQFAPSG